MIEKLIENKNTMKVLEHFIIHERWEQNVKDLCEDLEIYPKEMKTILKKLVEWDIIKKIKTIEMTDFYKINPNSKLINPLRVLIQEMSFFSSSKIAEDQAGQELTEEERELRKKIEGVIGLRFFMRFPRHAKCPICETNKNKPCILIQIIGTDDGEGNLKAHPFHIACLDLWYDAKHKFLIQKIGKK